MPIELPGVLLPGIEKIASISEADITEIRKALLSVKPNLKPSAIVAQLETAKIQIPDLTEIVQTLGSLNGMRINADLSVEEFTKNIAISIARWGGKPPNYDQPGFERRLASLLEIEPLILSARAFDIQHESERIFNSARIISDIRPVFGLSAVEPVAAMILHVLKIRYYQNGQFMESFFTLDNSDLIALRKVLDRAETKTTQLEQMILKTGVLYFESK